MDAAGVVSASYFSTLGVRAAIGRTFLDGEDRTPGTHLVALAAAMILGGTLL